MLLDPTFLDLFRRSRIDRVLNRYVARVTKLKVAPVRSLILAHCLLLTWA